MKHTETKTILDKIKESTKMDDKALKIIGVTEEKIDDAVSKMKSAGVSGHRAVVTILKMWKISEPKDENKN